MTAADAVVAYLDELLAATPPPPDGDATALLEAFTAMTDRRAALLDELAAVAPGPGRDPRIVERHGALVAREQAWMGALGRAQIQIGDQLVAVRRTRAYR